jgi:hypothetical protein
MRLEGKCPGTRCPEGTYRGRRHPDATRLDTPRLEVIWLDTLHLEGKCSGTRRLDANTMVNLIRTVAIYLDPDRSEGVATL